MGPGAYLRGAATALMALVTVGCTGHFAELPDERYYRLPESAPQQATAQFAGTIAVVLPSSDGLHAERAMLYSRHDRPLEILRHHYYFWTESPPRLVQEHLVEYLRSAGIAEHVFRAEAAPGHGLQLEARLLRFERQVGSDPTQVLVELELGWRSRSADTPPARRTYRAREAAADDTIYASVQAYGKALTDIYARFLRDMPPG